MERPVLFFHMFRRGIWKSVTSQLLKAVVDSGLAENMQRLYICVNDNNSLSNINIHGIPKEKVSFIRIDDTRTEWPTICSLYNLYKNVENTPILYFHTKGVSVEKKETIPFVDDWRKYLSYFNITLWRDCVNRLEIGCQAVGVNKIETPTPHYSGNFWWMNSSFLKNMIDPNKENHSYENRYGNEFWIGRNGSNFLYNLYNPIGPDGTQEIVGYGNSLPESVYKKKYDNEKYGIFFVTNTPRFPDFQILNIKHKMSLVRSNDYKKSYLEYIVNNYDHLDDFTFFAQSDTFTKNIKEFMETLKVNELNDFGWIGEQTDHAVDKSVFKKAYVDLVEYDNIKYSDSGIFYVSKKFIHNSPKIKYEEMLMDYNSNPFDIFSVLENFFFEEVRKVHIQPYILNDSSHCDHEKRAISIAKKLVSLGYKPTIIQIATPTKTRYLKIRDIHRKYGDGVNVVYSEDKGNRALWNTIVKTLEGTHAMTLSSTIKYDDLEQFVFDCEEFFKKNDGIFCGHIRGISFFDYRKLQDFETIEGQKCSPFFTLLCACIPYQFVHEIGPIDSYNVYGKYIEYFLVLNCFSCDIPVVMDYRHSYFILNKVKSKKKYSELGKKWLYSFGLEDTLKSFSKYLKQFTYSYSYSGKKEIVDDFEEFIEIEEGEHEEAEGNNT